MAKDDRNAHYLALGESFLDGVGEDVRRQVCTFDVTADDLAAWAPLIGVVDHDLLAGLHTVGLGRDALMALALVPVLEIARRSSASAQAKRRAMGETALELGFSAGDPGYKLLLGSTDSPGGGEILALWQRLLHGLVDELEPRVLSALQWELMDRAWRMTAALHGVEASRWPREVFAALTELEGTFCDTPRQADM